jgi:Type IV secretion system pilin
MFKNKTKLVTIIGLFFLTLVISNIFIIHTEASANLMLDISGQNIAFNQELGLQDQDPEIIIIKIINIVLGFVGLIFLVMILYSGFQWMTSGGNEEKITKAKQRLVSSTIGLGIILLAWVIANTVMLIIQGDPLTNWHL